MLALNRRGNLIDNDYFKWPDSKAAYAMGLIWADGCMAKNRPTVLLTLNDAGILSGVRDLICPDAKLYKKKSNSCYELHITNKEIYATLAGYGLHPNKSQTATFPSQLEGTLIPHFIRGYFDGDGCIFEQRIKRYVYPGINLLGSLCFLTSVADLLRFCKTRPYKRIDANIHSLNFHNKQAVEFMRYVYADLGKDDLAMSKKHERAKKWLFTF